MRVLEIFRSVRWRNSLNLGFGAILRVRGGLQVARARARATTGLARKVGNHYLNGLQEWLNLGRLLVILRGTWSLGAWLFLPKCIFFQKCGVVLSRALVSEMWTLHLVNFGHLSYDIVIFVSPFLCMRVNVQLGITSDLLLPNK